LSVDGTRRLAASATATASDAFALGADVARQLIAGGASGLIEEARRQT